MNDNESSILEGLDWTTRLSCESFSDEECDYKPRWIVSLSCGCTRLICDKHLFELFDIMDKLKPTKRIFQKKFEEMGMGDVKFHISEVYCDKHKDKCYVVSWDHIDLNVHESQ
jgi:hypothetical protein